MKKISMAVLVLILSLLLLSCATANVSNQIDSQLYLSNNSGKSVVGITKSNVKSNRNITEQQAIDIVRKKLLPLKLKQLSYYTSTDKQQWQVEVRFPAHAGLSHAQGFYFVNKKNGNLYEAFASDSDNLFPLTNITFVYESANNVYGNSSDYSTKLLNSAMKSKGGFASYFHLMKRGNKTYYCVAYLPSTKKSGLYDFYMINKTSHTIYKSNVKSDKLILYKRQFIKPLGSSVVSWEYYLAGI